ncbi:hypothetical protein [Candidatus Nitrosarchaeum limnium]|uniref:hypothetical protein n=1 Tax=Candidatus Nitrosarchaeum limnium TaxID=1007084 RepID=UPI001300C4DA|nr:hypothetical protein [Candidatus Nitrosarchaeum limnium]
MSDTYKVGFTCTNCNANKNYDVPKGVSTYDFKQKTKCYNCDVVALEAQKETFFE